MKRIVISLIVMLFAFIQVNVFASYIALIDAGSSGSRIYLYNIEDTEGKLILKSVPLDNIASKIQPGISNYANNPERVGADHIAPLIHAVRSAVIKEKPANYTEKDTAIFIFATAGMRSVSPLHQKKLYENVNKYLAENSNFREIEAVTVSGKMEGVFDWFAVNYQMNTLFSGNTKGVLDMGGASMQIAYAVNALHGVNSDYIDVKAGDKHYELFSHSYLGLGADHARFQFSDDADCFPKGFKMADGTGDGNFQQALNNIKNLLTKVRTLDARPNGTAFVGISNFYNIAAAAPFGLGKEITIDSFIKKSEEFSSKNWSDLEKENPNNPYLYSYLFNAAYIVAVLEVFGFNHNEKIEILNASWTTGAALYLYSNKLEALVKSCGYYVDESVRDQFVGLRIKEYLQKQLKLMNKYVCNYYLATDKCFQKYLSGNICELKEPLSGNLQFMKKFI